MTSIPLRHVLRPPEKGINVYLSGKSIGIPNWGFERRTLFGPGIASPERDPSTLRLKGGIFVDYTVLTFDGSETSETALGCGREGPAYEFVENSMC